VNYCRGTRPYSVGRSTDSLPSPTSLQTRNLPTVTNVLADKKSPYCEERKAKMNSLYADAEERNAKVSHMQTSHRCHIDVTHTPHRCHYLVNLSNTSLYVEVSPQHHVLRWFLNPFTPDTIVLYLNYNITNVT